MQTRLLALSVVCWSTACGSDPSGEDGAVARTPFDNGGSLEMDRKVRNPGFAYIDVDDDGRYDEDVDQEAVLDSSGELQTPYSLVIPFDKTNPTLWHDEQLVLTVGGSLDLDGEIGCLTSCVGSGCLVGTHTCSVDIEVAGDITSSSRSAIYALSGLGEAWVSITAGGDIDLKSVELTASELYPSTDDGRITVDAEGDLDAPAMDAIVDLGGHRTVELSSNRQFLTLNKVDISADEVTLETCKSGSTGCSYVPVVDLKKFQLDSGLASLCLDGDDITAGSTSLVSTNNKTATNTCD